MKKKLQIAILVAVLAALVWYVYTLWPEVSQLQIVSWLWFIPLVIAILAHLLFTGIMNGWCVRAAGVHLSINEEFGLAAVTRLGNYIVPFRGGMAFRGVYLYKKYKLSVTDFILTLAGSYVVIFAVSSLIGLACLWMLYVQQGVMDLLLAAVFSGLFVTMCAIMLFSPKLPEYNNAFLKKVQRVVNGWHEIRSQKRILSYVVLFGVLQLIAYGGMIFAQFAVFGVQISVLESLFLTSVNNLAILLQITPAGLGITEGLLVYSADVIGISHAQSLASALLGRITTLALLIVMIPAYGKKFMIWSR